jgi:hypothetical protein
MGVTFSWRVVDSGLFEAVLRRRLGAEPFETGIVTFRQSLLLPRRAH